MLEVYALNSFYGRSQALHDFSLSLAPGEVLCLLGRNGAGKTTALRSIMGLVRPKSGWVRLDGTQLDRLPAHQVPVQGIGYVPQGRRLFSELTVRENLAMGQLARKTDDAAKERALDFFPVLRERLDQRSGTLSGGEQTMLAIARALCIEPKVVLMDEPTEGLMPSMIGKIRDVVVQLRELGVSTILVEQRVEAVLSIADRVVFLETGKLRATVPVAELRKSPALLHKYLGVGH
ncbi:MAG: ABC transporter ATP-binding protein [Bradyrhizobium sp.]